MITKFFIFQALILAPFAAGYLLKNRLSDAVVFTRKIMRLNLIAIEPLIVLWSIWGMRIGHEYAVLPLAGLALVLAGGGLGQLANSLMGLSGIRKKTFLISASLANHGFTMGGFLCYLLLGEKGLGLSFIFISYFMPYIFLFIFPYAGLKSGEAREGAFKNIWRFLLNPQNMPLLALAAALILHSSGIERPSFPFPVDILMFASLATYYFSLGLNFSFGDFGDIKKENASLALIKFLVLPLLTFLVLRAVPLAPAVKEVIFIQSFMPAAIYSVVSSVLFDLDARLASGMFVFNTILFLLVILPLSFFLRGFLLPL